MRTAADDAPKEVLAASAENAGWWGRAKSWVPKRPAASVDDKIKNPHGIHLAYARWQESIGNLVEARESYELALGDDPKSADAILGLARLDQLNNRQFDAEQRYLKALKMKPNDPHVLEAVGQYYASQERWDKSIELLTEAVRVAPQETSHRFNLAVALARAGRIDQAMPHFSQTVGAAEAHYNIGYILYQKNDLVGAERHLLQAVVARPELGQAQEMLDVVRREQADKQMFAGNPRQNARYQSGYANRVQPAAVRESGNRDVVPAAGTQGGRQDYRQQYVEPQPQFDNRPAAAAPRNDYRTPPPWHASPDFHRGPATNQNPPAAGQPTAEQLEQWRNQLSPQN